MSYQNVGTPRFYVDIYSYYKAIGLTAGAEVDDTDIFNMGLNPSNAAKDSVIMTGTSQQVDYENYGWNFSKVSQNSIDNQYGKRVVGFLGHNFATENLQARVKLYIGASASSTGTAEQAYGSGTEIVNWAGNDEVPPSDGFTLYEVSGDIDGDEFTNITLRLGTEDTETKNPKLGSLFVGTYYDMPHSPDLSLKLSYEMDGIKNIQTKGGSTLSNATYTKPADWGSGGAWQLNSNEAGQGLSNLRSGRRTWDLSFSYLSDTDVMPENGITANGDYDTNILDGNNFFSQVWNKTMGGHLPFIFQPDGGDNSTNSPDGFAIARFDQSSLQYEQVAHNTYNVKLKIRESW